MFDVCLFRFTSRNDSASYFLQTFQKTAAYDSINSRSVVGNKAKGRISRRVFQENKAHQIFRKTNISNPVRNVRFSENLACFVFLKHVF